MNKCIIIGYACGEPNEHVTQSGISRADFRVGVSRKYGEHETDFFTVVAWRQTAEFCLRNITKGRRVSVSGAMQCRSYDDANNGCRRYVWELLADEVELLGAAVGDDKQELA